MRCAKLCKRCELCELWIEEHAAVHCRAPSSTLIHPPPPTATTHHPPPVGLPFAIWTFIDTSFFLYLSIGEPTTAANPNATPNSTTPIMPSRHAEGSGSCSDSAWCCFCDAVGACMGWCCPGENDSHAQTLSHHLLSPAPLPPPSTPSSCYLES